MLVWLATWGHVVCGGYFVRGIFLMRRWRTGGWNEEHVAICGLADLLVQLGPLRLFKCKVLFWDTWRMRHSCSALNIQPFWKGLSVLSMERINGLLLKWSRLAINKWEFPLKCCGLTEPVKNIHRCFQFLSRSLPENCISFWLHCLNRFSKFAQFMEGTKRFGKFQLIKERTDWWLD